MAWYNASWTKRKAITLTGGASGAQTDYQVKLTVTWDSDMKSDFSDLRFTKLDGTTLLNAWLETHTASTTATIWVATDTPANTVEADIYMYYGNSGAASGWNGANTFPDLFDDFEDNNVTGWTGTMAVESSTVKSGTYSGMAEDGASYKTGASKTSDYTIDFDLRFETHISAYFSIGKNGGTANAIYIYRSSGANAISYYDGSSWNFICGILNNTWFKYSINVHFSTNTFDISVNGVSEGTGLSTNGSISELNDINLNPQPREEYLDNVFSRKYAANPATYEFGIEELPGWYNEIMGVSSPAKIMGVESTNIASVTGVEA